MNDAGVAPPPIYGWAGEEHGGHGGGGGMGGGGFGQSQWSGYDQGGSGFSPSYVGARPPSAAARPAGGRSYRGVGPRGHRRSDDRVREDVCEWLTHDEDIDASEMSVSVEAGVVTLSGLVPDRRTKRLAEDCIHGIPGVLDVQNLLRISPAGGR